MVQLAVGTPSHRGVVRFFGPVALTAVAALTAAVVLYARPGPAATAPRPRHVVAHGPALGYWTVRQGDTLTTISTKTGVTVTTLEALNPDVDPNGLQPGERLKLSAHPPAPAPKPLGPKFWVVQPGQSFGYIAAKTGIDLDRLEQLNRGVSPATLQPGQRVRLRA